jgi:hypothetical protein
MQRLGKHGSAETNTHATIEEMLDACFLCSRCLIKYSICGERKATPLHVSRSCETVKFAHEYRGNRNQGWLCWRGPNRNLSDPNWKESRRSRFPRTSCLIILPRWVRHVQLTNPVSEISFSDVLNWRNVSPPIHLRMETNSVPETLCSSEYYLVDKFLKFSNPECTIPTAQHYNLNRAPDFNKIW